MHSLYLISLLVILVVLGAPVVAFVVVVVLLGRRRTPAAAGLAPTQLADGKWISADGKWEWDGHTWKERPRSG